jgi:hypothetical protein
MSDDYFDRRLGNEGITGMSRMVKRGLTYLSSIEKLTDRWR